MAIGYAQTALTAPPAASGLGRHVARFLLCIGLAGSSMLAFRVGNLAVGDFLTIAALLCAAFDRVLESTASGYSLRGPRLSTFWLWGALAFGTVITITRSVAPANDIATLGRLTLLIFCLPWLLRYAYSDMSGLLQPLAWLGAGGAASGAVALAQVFVDPDIIPGTQITTAGRVPGLTQIVSDAGGIGCICTLACIIWLLRTTRRTGRLVALACMALCGIGLILSGSVSGMISLVIGLLAFVGFKAIRLRTMIAIVTLGFLVLLYAESVQSQVGGLNPIQRFIQSTGNGQYNSTDSRFGTYEIALGRAIASPLVGVGIDPGSTLINKLYDPHNIFVNAFYGGGVLVLLTFFTVIARVFVRIPRRLDRHPIHAATLSIALTATVFAMTAPSIFNRYFWVPIAFAHAAKTMTRTARKDPEG